MNQGTISVGIGGWDYDPWRGSFFPAGLAKTKQLHFASRAMTAIEVNATYYRLQRPDLFRRWADTTPDGFKFAIKASRYCTNRKTLADAGESVEKFLAQGLTELGSKLGPILWQFMATKKFDADEFGAFLKLLPPERDGVTLAHAIEVRHDSFKDPRFVDLVRGAGAAIVYADAEEFPAIGDLTADFVYARLLRARAEEPLGYTGAELDRWADVARDWAQGKSPDGIDTMSNAAAETPRDTYVFMINGAKERAPAAATALIERVERPS